MDAPSPTSRPPVQASRAAGVWIYLLLIVVTLVVTAVAIDRQISFVGNTVRQITLSEAPFAEAAYELEINVLGIGMAVVKYIERADPADRERVAKDASDFERFEAQYNRLADTPQQKELGLRVGALYREYKALGERMMDARDRERALAAELARDFAEIDALIKEQTPAEADRETAESVALVRTLTELGGEVAEAGNWLGTYLRPRTDEYRERVAQRLREMRDEAGRFSVFPLPPELRSLSDELKSAVERTRGRILEILALDAELLDGYKRFTALRTELDDLLDEEIQVRTAPALAAAQAAATATIKTLRATNLGLFGFGLIVSIGAAAVILRRSSQLAAANIDLKGEIAERAKAEQARTQLLEKLVSAQEEERRRIARELHDQMGQDLSAMMLELKACDDAAAPGEIARRIEQLRTLAEQMIQDLHLIAWELRPSMLDDLGLKSALGNYAEHWTRRTGIAVDFLGKLDGERLPPHVEATLYRVGQEALQNVLKHGGAKSVSVILDRRRDHVALIVEDDGRGFDPASIEAPTGTGRLGLLGMRERVALLGGTVEIESSPGAGATIVARVPLAGPPLPAS